MEIKFLEIGWNGMAYGYDAEADCIVVCPTLWEEKPELFGKGSMSHWETVKKQVPNGDWKPCDDRPFLLEEARAEIAREKELKASLERAEAKANFFQERDKKIILSHNGRDYRWEEALYGFYVEGLSETQIESLRNEGFSVYEEKPSVYYVINEPPEEE